MLLTALLFATLTSAQGQGAWPAWRGPLSTGYAPDATPPLHWSATDNVRWKLALPGAGQSTPIVWGERVFLTAAVPHGERLTPAPESAPGAHDNAPVTHAQEFVVLAVNRSNGEIEWQRTLKRALPHERAHVSATFASASPVTDGERLFAFFGSRGVFALGLEGELFWEKDLGDMQVKHAHGEGASPALFGDTLVVNWDHEGASCVVALDTDTGKERWRKPRPGVTSWSTPLIVQHAGRAQVIVSGSLRLSSYDLETGAELWSCDGLSRNVVASPVSGNGMVFAASSYGKQALLAITLEGARGDLTRSDKLAWIRRRSTSYVPSPLLYDDTLYFLHHYQPTLSRVDARTGAEATGPFRLGALSSIYASPVGAAGRLYITDLEGTTAVLEHGPEARILAVNRLGEAVSASAALVDGELYLRGQQHLFCIAEEP